MIKVFVLSEKNTFFLNLLCSLLCFALLCFAIKTHSSLIQEIEGLKVEVQDENLCPICLDIKKDSFFVSPSICNHLFCNVCLGHHLEIAQSSRKTCQCPLCRESFTQTRPRKEVEMHYERLICPGCQKVFSREAINEHLVSCEKNKQTYQDRDQEVEQAYLEYLEKNPKKYVSNNIDSSHTTAARVYDENNRIIHWTVLSGNNKDDVFLGYRHSIFMDCDNPPEVSVVQFNEPENVSDNFSCSQSKELLCVSSMCGYFSFQPEKMPADLQLLLSEGQEDRIEKMALYHSIVAVQENHGPLTLALTPQVASKTLDLTRERRKVFLLYRINVPGQKEDYWGIQEVVKDRRILLELSEDLSVIEPAAMTEQQERQIQESAGYSVRDNATNSVRCELYLFFDPSYIYPDALSSIGRPSYDVTPTQTYPKSHQFVSKAFDTKRKYMVARGSGGIVFCDGAEGTDDCDSPVSPVRDVCDSVGHSFETQATMKLLSRGFKLSEKLCRPAKDRVNGHSLILMSQSVVFLDIVYSGFPVSPKSIPAPLLSEIAEQQRKILHSINKEADK